MRLAIDRRSSLGGWLIGCRTGNAGWRRRLRAVSALDQLLASHRTAIHRLIGLVGLGGAFGLREIQLRSDLRLHVLLADQGLQHVQNAPAVDLLDLLHILQLLSIHTCSTIRVGGQQLAGVIQHTDGSGVHLRHTGRDQVHDTGELAFVQRAAGVQAQQHGGRGLLLLPEKAILIRQSQVHPGTRYRSQSLDGTGQLALQAALECQALLKLGHAEAIGLHHLEPADRAFGQTLRSQLQTDVMHTLGRDHDGAAAFGVLIGNIHGGQLGDDRATVFVCQVRVQHAPLCLAPHDHTDHSDCNKQRNAQRQANALPLV